MKKIITAAVVAGMVVSLGGISTIAADTTPERGTISVSTTANPEISPDTVVISISVKM